jgi:hypothetical protein
MDADILGSRCRTHTLPVSDNPSGLITGADSCTYQSKDICAWAEDTPDAELPFHASVSG